ncbi:MAG: pyridoxal-dependent decarboxylase, partial [Chloroflexota bacterium]|nr:pyridoxal-dependent decarboxylase [Chloroflexota bacterium]
RADSVVVNPHKWLFTPVDLSTFFTRHLDTVADAFTLIPAYLQTPEREGERNYMNYGPQLGRRFRALKLWFVLRAYGREGIVRRLREHLRLAQLFAQLVGEDGDWEIMAPVPFSNVCFRAHPSGCEQVELNDLNQKIEDAVNATGEVFIAHTMLGDALTLRLAIGNVRTEERHVLRTWELLQGALREVRV